MIGLPRNLDYSPYVIDRKKGVMAYTVLSLADIEMNVNEQSLTKCPLTVMMVDILQDFFP